MMTLAAEKRDPEVKAKKLRREGYSTGVLYGREMKENVSLKYTEKDALNFIKKAIVLSTKLSSWTSSAGKA